MYVYYQSPFVDVTKEFVSFLDKICLQQRDVERYEEFTKERNTCIISLIYILHRRPSNHTALDLGKTPPSEPSSLVWNVSAYFNAL